MAAQEQVEIIKRKIRKSERTKKNIEKFKDQVNETKKTIDVVMSKFKKIQEKLPEKQDDAKTYDLLKKMAEKFRIQDITFDAGIENNKGLYIEKNYLFKGVGTYRQFLSFFDEVSVSKRLFNIKNISFKSKKSRRVGKFQLITGDVNINAYRYNANNNSNKGQ